MSTKIEFLSAAPQLVVPNVVTTAEYYRDKLGFEILGYFQDPPVYAIVRRGNVEIHFGRGDSDRVSSNTDIRRGSIDVYIFVSGVRDLYDEFLAAGVDVPYPPTLRVYDRTEIEIIDRDGHKIVFGE
jgi:hypothetical protein